MAKKKKKKDRIGKVYRIIFPCGETYLGATCVKIRNRMTGHILDGYSYPSKKWGLMMKAGIDKVVEMTEVIYEGLNYMDYEGYLISIGLGGSLNSIQPSFNKEIGREIHKKEHTQ